MKQRAVYTKRRENKENIRVGTLTVDSTGTTYIQLFALPVDGVLIIPPEEKKP